MTKTNQQSFTMPRGKSYYLESLIIAFFVSFGFAAISLFVPDFMFHTQWFLNTDGSYFAEFNNHFFVHGTIGQQVAAGFYWASYLITILLGMLGVFMLVRQLFIIANTNKWWNTYISSCTQIINSCDASKFNDKVAMVVCTCNDIVPNTILQSAHQTYKNMDVWVSDDSNKPEVIEQLDAFCKKNGYHVLHRDIEHKKKHPTKIGNLYYFIEKYGHKYDYIYVNDSSSIVTERFVENSLCYFNTPLLDHSMDAAVVCNGSFYGNKNLISYLYSYSSQFADFINGPLQIAGYPIMLAGWCSLYKTSILKTIPLEAIECPSDDTASGYWLTARGYKNYNNPFDFSGKVCPQNIEAIKNQWLKWTGADAFMFRTGLSLAKYPDIKVRILIWLSEISKIIIMPLTLVNFIVFTILSCYLNFFYLNFSIVILLTSFVIIFLAIYIWALVSRHISVKFIAFLAFYAFVGLATLYKKSLQTIKCIITKTWSSGAVTVKGTQKLTTRQKLKMARFDFVIILILAAICTTLTILSFKNIITLQPVVIWFTIFTIFAGPSILYIIFIWLGDIPVKTGWHVSYETYNFWEKDFKYEDIVRSEIWQKQHKKNEA